MAPSALVVNGLGEEFFTGAGLAGDQDGNIMSCVASSEVEDITELLASADEGGAL